MAAFALRQVLIDGGDRAGGGLETRVQRLGQSRQPVSEAVQQDDWRGAAVYIKLLTGGPAKHRGIIRQEIGRIARPPPRGVDEVEPQGIA